MAAMIDDKFEASVFVKPGGSGTIREVKSVNDACEVLVDWPHARRGPFYQEAREIVEAAMKGEKTAAEAREAFAALAAHAGILIEREASA